MFSLYFENLEKSLLKKYKAVVARTVKNKVAESTLRSKKSAAEYNELIAAINSITPPDLKIMKQQIIDKSDYTTNSVDFIACKAIFEDLEGLFPEAVPSELVYAAYHVCPVINRKNLVDVLVRAANTRKLDQYINNSEDIRLIPSFIIAFNSTYNLKELKQSILDVYAEESVAPQFEFDIMIILGEGIVIKDWRDKRSYIALETKNDSLKWFFVLMNEYLEVEKNQNIDLRSYVKETEKYAEY